MKQISACTSVCMLLLFLLTSCHTGKQAVAHKSAKPKFINDIYMNGHNKSSATANAIKPTVVPEKQKHTTKAASATATQEPEQQYAQPLSERLAEKPVPKKLRNKYSEIIGVRAKDIDNYPLYYFIDRWYGTNYRLGGSDESGIDCSGFAQKLYGEVYGVDLLRTAMEQFKNCKRIKKSDDAEEGDLVFFKQHSKRITHVGIYLANDFFVHASTSQGVIISNLKEEYWHKHYAGMGRIHKSGHL